jgi:V/A-type H+-transporting ATPase subunit A
MVYLQQDAFDPVDISVPTDRQKDSFLLIRRLIDRTYQFSDKDETREFFTSLTRLYKNLNYSHFDSNEYRNYLTQIEQLEQQGIVGESRATASPI